jgi:hypothetical protein
LEVSTAKAREGRVDQRVSEALVVAFAMVVDEELTKRVPGFPGPSGEKE